MKMAARWAAIFLSLTHSGTTPFASAGESVAGAVAEGAGRGCD